MLALAAISAPGTAEAGRTFYGWLFPTEIMPARRAELVTWVQEVNRGDEAANAKSTLWGFTGFVGVTDRLELSFPIELTWSRSDARAEQFTFDRYGAEARYIAVASAPADGPAFAVLVRGGAKRVVAAREAIRPEADVVASVETGRLHVLADLGFVGVIAPGPDHFELRPSLGVSVLVTGHLRLGAEVYAELSLDDRKKSWAVAGPNLAWTHGRFWLSAMYGFGIYDINNAPRVNWGVAF
jgi:hypothetical protein